MADVIGIPPLKFVHVLDQNTNTTFLEVGPLSFLVESHQKLIAGPLPFIVVPPGHYCTIRDPIRSIPEAGEPYELEFGQYKICFHADPFPLYPGEVLEDAKEFMVFSKYKSALKPLPVVKSNHGILLEARLDHVSGDGTERQAGDLWQLEGPLTYQPVAEVKIKGFVEPQVIRENEALLLMATQGFTDRNGIERVTGEQWLVKTKGAYLLDVYENLTRVASAHTLTELRALHLRATQTVVDALGKTRLAGDEWLLTNEDTESYIPDVGVELVKFVNKTVLPKSTYCVVLDPVDDKGRPQLGQRELRKGVDSFFLHPGESLEETTRGARKVGIQKAYILTQRQSIVLQALDAFIDDTFPGQPRRTPGDRWMIVGPIEYIPPVEVKVMDTREAIPLSKNEGIYVRDTQTGAVRCEMGPQSYLLTAYEELYEKHLPDIVETMLKQGGGHGSSDIRKLAYYEQSIDPAVLAGRDKTRVVTYRCPGNSAVQVYNYKKKTARVIFGPDLVILGPHENFNYLSLSAGKPKQADALKSLCLMLGPDFITDILVVETSDHARLQIKLAFNNHFEIEKGNQEIEAKIFSISDFIGYACRQIGSKIRASVAHTSFDEFHRNSAQVIQYAVFGKPSAESPSTTLKFEANNLVISSLDVQSIEPVDTRMRDSLMKSVQMAIEIATNSVEASASHEAKRVEQAARGRLERQKLTNEKEAEKERVRLCELQAITAAVESCGQSKAEAQAHAEKILIECQSEIEVTRLQAEALDIEHRAKLEAQKMLRASELRYSRDQVELEVKKAEEMAGIEVDKFSSMVKTIGPETIAAIATAGPESQVNLLKSLGLQSMLITDGKSPINLFNTAQGLVGQES